MRKKTMQYSYYQYYFFTNSGCNYTVVNCTIGTILYNYNVLELLRVGVLTAFNQNTEMLG